MLRYKEWMEESKRLIVKKALRHAEEHGIEEPHHFYMTFRTQYPGVQVPEILAAAYPEEVKILIRQSFWNLRVHEDSFSVELLFHDKRQTFVVPFKALVNFLDPAAEFGLQFVIEPLPEKAFSPAHSGSPNVIMLDRFRKPQGSS